MTQTLRPTAYEPLVPASDLENAVRDQMVKWLPSYLWEIERQQGGLPGELVLPRSYVIGSAVERMPEEKLPSIVIASEGLTDRPLADGRGMYTARWRLRMAAQIAARGNRIALRLARLYAAAIRGVALQQPDLVGLTIRGVDWEGERYDTLDSIDDRTISISEVTCAYEVVDIITRYAGPLVPYIVPEDVPDPESPTWPVSTDVDIDIDKLPLEDES